MICHRVGFTGPKIKIRYPNQTNSGWFRLDPIKTKKPKNPVWIGSGSRDTWTREHPD